MHRRNRSRTLTGRPPKPFFTSIPTASSSLLETRPFTRSQSSPDRKCPAAPPALSLQPSSPELTLNSIDTFHLAVPSDDHAAPLPSAAPVAPASPAFATVSQPDHQPAFVPHNLPFWSPPNPPLPRPVPIVAPQSDSIEPRVRCRRRGASVGNRQAYQPYAAAGCDSSRAFSSALNETSFPPSRPGVPDPDRVVIIQYCPGTVTGPQIASFLEHKLGNMTFHFDDKNGMAVAVLAGKHGRLAKPQRKPNEMLCAEAVYNYARAHRLTLAVTVVSDSVGHTVQ